MIRLITSDGTVRKLDADGDVSGEYERWVAENRRLAEEHGFVLIDVMGTIGAGKTALIAGLVGRLGYKRIAVINGDLATTVDRDRIQAVGAVAVQINTDRSCHLDARMVNRALRTLDLGNLDLVVVENVGNLICPAGFGLGSVRRACVISITDGPYLVRKHPHVFGSVDWVIVNKMDLAGVCGQDGDQLRREVLTLNPEVVVIMTSVVEDMGLEELAMMVRNVHA